MSTSNRLPTSNRTVRRLAALVAATALLVSSMSLMPAAQAQSGEVELQGSIVAGSLPVEGVLLVADGLLRGATDANGEFVINVESPGPELEIYAAQNEIYPAFALFGPVPASSPVDLVLPEIVLLEVRIEAGFYAQCRVAFGCPFVGDSCEIDPAFCTESRVEIFEPLSAAGFDGEWQALGLTTDGSISFPVFNTPGSTINIETESSGFYDFVWDGSNPAVLELGSNLDLIDWFIDADGDSYGDHLSTPVQSPATVRPGSSYVDNSNDCNDSSGWVFPGAFEIAGNGIDEDCDGQDASAASGTTCVGYLVTIDMRLGDPGQGTSGPDVILGTSGDDVIYGNGGDDIICAGGGDDQVFGGAGNDFIQGGDGNDDLRGQDGNDDIRANGGDDVVYGGNGNDLLRGGADADFVAGGHGDDRVYGSFGDDDLRGNTGNDRLWGGAGNDVVYAGLGDDWANGGQDDDVIYGQAGFDELFGGAGIDDCNGGADTDIAIGCETVTSANE